MPIFCTNCGAQIAEAKKFCENCGAKVEQAAAPEPEQKQEQAAVKEPEPPAAPKIQLQLEPNLDFEEPKPPPAPQPPPPQPQPQYQPQQFTPPPPVVTPAYTAALSEAPPPKNSPYTPTGTLAYMGLMILFNIPLIGLIASIVLAFTSKNVNRRNYGRAVLIFFIIQFVLSIGLAIFFWIVWAQIAGYFSDLISEYGSV